jgi:hypothetical protein
MGLARRCGPGRRRTLGKKCVPEGGRKKYVIGGKGELGERMAPRKGCGLRRRHFQGKDVSPKK